MASKLENFEQTYDRKLTVDLNSDRLKGPFGGMMSSA